VHKSAVLLHARQFRHCFAMRGLGEHIERGDAFQFVAGLDQLFDIAREHCRPASLSDKSCATV
jgi:hypothetical protein